MDAKRCVRCKFYESVAIYGGDDPHGFCCRLPPVLWAGKREKVFELDCWAQPMVLASSWCGEWQAIESTT